MANCKTIVRGFKCDFMGYLASCQGLGAGKKQYLVFNYNRECRSSLLLRLFWLEGPEIRLGGPKMVLTTPNICSKKLIMR